MSLCLCYLPFAGYMVVLRKYVKWRLSKNSFNIPALNKFFLSKFVIDILGLSLTLRLAASAPFSLLLLLALTSGRPSSFGCLNAVVSILSIISENTLAGLSFLTHSDSEVEGTSGLDRKVL